MVRFEEGKQMMGKKMVLHGLLPAIVFLIIHFFRLSSVLSQPCRADINNDGKVNYSDLMILDAALERDTCSVSPCEGDVDRDGKITGNDKEILANEFGRRDCTPFMKEREFVQNTQAGVFEDDGTKHKGESIPADGVAGGQFKEGISRSSTRFKDNSDGTVTDSKTGLMWTRDANLGGNTLLFHQAINYIAGMNEGERPDFGYTGWRLPTLRELQQLLDYSEYSGEGHGLTEGHPFQNVQLLRFYERTAPTYLHSTEHSWFVNAYCRIVGHNVQSCYGFLWPVREEQQNPQRHLATP